LQNESKLSVRFHIKCCWSNMGQARCEATTFSPLAGALSRMAGAVATTLRRFRLFLWNKPKLAVPLHRRKETDDNINKKYNN